MNCVNCVCVCSCVDVCGELYLFISSSICLHGKDRFSRLLLLIFIVCSRDVMKDKHSQTQLNHLCVCVCVTQILLKIIRCSTKLKLVMHACMVKLKGKLMFACWHSKYIYFSWQSPSIDHCLSGMKRNFSFATSCTSLLCSSVLYKCVPSTLHASSHVCGQKVFRWCCWDHCLVEGLSAWPNYPVAPSLQQSAL